MISIIIPVYNGETVIEKCLDSVLGSAGHINYEILIIDDGSTDKSAEIIKRYLKDNVSLLTNSRNVGFSRAVNRGINSAKGEIAVFLNMDTIVEHGWLKELIKPFKDHPCVGITGSKIFYMDNGLVQHAGGYLDKAGLSGHIGDKKPDNGEYERQMSMDYVCGASMACRMDVLKKLGRFDPGYSPMYYEEIDLADRFRRAGYSVMYIPCSRLSHYQGYSVKKNGFDIFYFSSRGRIRYVLKTYSLKKILFGFIIDEIRYFLKLDKKNKKTILKSYIYNIIILPEILFTRLKDSILISNID
jgi:GT2 family glycosyltransferase